MRMTQYVNSNDILVFPSSRRSDFQASARYQQESTFSEIIANLSDYASGSFIATLPVVLTADSYEYSGSLPFEFYIHGYWFRIRELDSLLDLFTTATDIYAYIELETFLINSDTDEERQELTGRDILISEATDTTDEVRNYNGIKFSDSEPAISDSRFCLHLFSRESTSDSWYNSIVQTSLYKFTFNTIELVIDGGVILKD